MQGAATVTLSSRRLVASLTKEVRPFELDGVKVARNKTGSAYSFPGLLRKRGVFYGERDNPALIAAAAGEVVQRNESSPLKDTNLLQQPPQPKPQQKKRKSQLSLD
ncbi:MAG TPA: hypothetical protein V6C90_15215 [Coleofasciculaceae cyanobacterium]